MLLNLVLFLLLYAFICGIVLGIITQIRELDKFAVAIAILWPLGIPLYIGWWLALILIHLFN